MIRHLYIRCLFLSCFLALGLINTVYAQEQSMVQLKTLDHKLNPYPGLKVVLNGGEPNKVNDQGLAFVEISTNDLPPTTVQVLDDKLDVESWNFSRGILEVVVRPKTYQEVSALLRDHNNQPISGTTVVYNSNEPIAAVSDQNGKIVMNLPIDHDLNQTNLFSVNGYKISAIKFKGSSGTIRLMALPKKAESKTISKSSTIIDNSARELSRIDNFRKFDFDFLDSIQSLTVFYAVIKNVDIDNFDDELKRKIDQKFHDLVNSRDDSLAVFQREHFLGNITDSSLIERDVSLLIEQAMIEQQSLDRIRDQFDKNVAVLEDKLSGGGTNLSNADQMIIIEGIKRLNEILNENERKFFQNQAQFQRLLDILRSKLTDIDELEEKLLISELQREEQSKAFTKRLITAIAVALALGLFGTISFVLTRKFQKQKNQLSKANAEVKRVNEHLEELVSERTVQLQETNQELDTFLYKSSHDLRRPLTSILGLSNIAHMTLGSEASELFDRAAETARNMDRMLQKLINVNEINNPSHYHPIDFSKHIQNSIAQNNELIDEKNIEVKSQIQSGINFSSYPDLIEIIMQNLLENALFFSSINKGNHPEVKVAVTQQNGHVSINLEDNGCGVDPAIQHKIWNMFFVGHERSTGNGLGLYIAKKAVKALQGEISYNSNATNTVFEVRLPVNGR